MTDGGLSRATHLNLLALDAPPLNDGAANDARGGHDGSDEEGLRQGVAVRQSDAGKDVRGDGGLDGGGAGAEDDERVDGGCVLGEALDELVGEDVLADGDEESAAEGLGEDDDGGAGGDV